MILPVAVNAMNMIIMRNFFQALPDSLEESAKWMVAQILVYFQNYAAISVTVYCYYLAFFYAVTYWNTYMTAILYINDSSKWPIQILLRQIVIVSSGMQAESSAVDVIPPAQTVKMAVIVIATVPMLIVYPFVQKYFVKGALVGSVKG